MQNMLTDLCFDHRVFQVGLMQGIVRWRRATLIWVETTRTWSLSITTFFLCMKTFVPRLSSWRRLYLSCSHWWAAVTVVFLN